MRRVRQLLCAGNEARFFLCLDAFGFGGRGGGGRFRSEFNNLQFNLLHFNVTKISLGKLGVITLSPNKDPDGEKYHPIKIICWAGHQNDGAKIRLSALKITPPVFSTILHV